MKPVRIVSATRLSEGNFWRSSLLGQSLRIMPEGLRPELALRFDNVGDRLIGLSALYNRALDNCPNGYHLVFVHDDVYLHDAFLAQRLTEAHAGADVVGLAGSRGTDLDQPSWLLHFDENLNGLGWQQGPGIVLSGAVAHSPARFTDGRPPPTVISEYGRTPAAVDLLDGLFLSVRTERVKEAGVRFDERFDFHLYDIDFCRSAKAARLRLWTAPILVTHASGGNYAAPGWKRAARLYRAKWLAPELERAIATG